MHSDCLRGGLVLRRLGIGRMRAAQRVNVAGHVEDFVGLERLLPGDHPLFRHAIPDGLHVISEVAAVDPIVITQVWPNQSTRVRAVARGASVRKVFLPCASALGSLEGVNVAISDSNWSWWLP